MPKPTELRAALYGRVSTKDRGQDTEVQLRELREFASRRGWQVFGEYVDNGVSGAKENRPELDRLMADAHKRRFDLVIVWKFDRFARSVSHLVRALETFSSLGIEFVSLGEQVDTTTAAGKLMFQIIAAMAEFERSLISERVRAGLRNAQAKGRKLGRPEVELNKDLVRSMRERGSSWKAIAGELGVSVGKAFNSQRR